MKIDKNYYKGFRSFDSLPERCIYSYRSMFDGYYVVMKNGSKRVVLLYDRDLVSVVHYRRNVLELLADFGFVDATSPSEMATR